MAKALQEALPEPYFILGNDIFTDKMCPEKFKRIDWPEMECQSLEMMFKTARLFSDEGKNVIVDSVLLNVMKRDMLRECVTVLHDYPLLFVHVVCGSVEELSVREEKRGDRDIGQGAGQLDILVPQDTYDVVVDTYGIYPLPYSGSNTNIFFAYSTDCEPNKFFRMLSISSICCFESP